MENNKRLYDKGAFSTIYKNLHSDKTLVETLISMQLESGINECVAAENAEAMIRDASYRETVVDMISTDARGTFESFLNESDKMNGYDRKLMLHEMYFGLKVYHDEDLGERIKNGATVDELFREYYEQYGEDPSVTEEFLQNQILEMVGDYNISAGAMKTIAKRLEYSDDMLATSAILGKEGLRFKCVASMELYLHNNDHLTIEEAVNVACTDAEIEAVSDAVSTGEITRRTASKLLGVIILAVGIAGLAMMLMKPMLTGEVVQIIGEEVLVQGVYKSFFSTGFNLLALCGLGTLTHADVWISRLLGTATANIKYRYTIKKEESKAAKAMMDMAEEAEAVAIEYDDVDNEDNIFVDDENPQPLNA